MKLLSTEELIDHEFPVPDFLVDPIIPQGGNVLLYGKPGVGKTMVLMTIAACLNNGYDLFGRWPVNGGPVTVMQGDMSGQIQKQRLQQAREAIDLPDTYWLTNEDGSTPIIDIMKLALTEKALVEKLREIDPVLNAWDTLRKVHRLPENESSTPPAVYQAAAKILPLATQLWLHHLRKASRDPDAIISLDEEFMGNIQWLASADAGILIENLDPDASPARLKITLTKARTAPDWMKKPFYVEIDTRNLTVAPIRAFQTHDPANAFEELRCSRDEALRLQG